MLKDKRKELIEYIKEHRVFLNHNAQALDIYEGNLLPYVDAILKMQLSPNYYDKIKHRNMPINILQRFIDKVSTTYSKEPVRQTQNNIAKEYLDYYKKALSINVSGGVADVYSHLFKGFAWEPFINNKGQPELRELPFNSFLVFSDSESNPEEETVFLKIMGCKEKGNEDSMLIFAYTNEEFDAFYLNGGTAQEYLIENEGVNLYGVIPFVYGKRQKNKLIPTLDSDMLAMAKTIPVLICDAAGAQMFQAFSIIYGIDIGSDNMVMSPNAFWSLKSDRETDKAPQVGTIKPEADTDKIMQFIVNVFVLWLETKGIRVGSMGSMDGGNVASGIAKIIDEMDAWELKKKSQAWFKKDEEELWNEKLPKIHNYWIKSGMLKAPIGILPENFDPEITVEFDEPTPMISRAEEVANIKAELELKTMTLKQAIMKLHPDYKEDQVQEVLEDGKQVDEGEDSNIQVNQTSGESTDSQSIN